MSSPSTPDPEKLVAPPDKLVTRHLRVGFLALAVFIVLGVVLEAFHATKAPFYLDQGNETTRLLLRLAHAHGTLLSIVNVIYALTIKARPNAATNVASGALLLALLLLPAGFFIGGLFARGADPGLGIVLVPAGALFLLVFAIVVGRRV
jgi:hypothetical protein